jgi:hypothetical protein
MIRFLLRFVGLLLLALAFIFVIYDGMKSIAGGGILLTRFSQFWREIHAGSLDALQATVEHHVNAEVWQNAVAPVLNQPAFVICGVLGIVLILLGRKKKPLIGYARS